MVLFSTIVHVPTRQPRKVIYRTYKIFDAEKYNYDLSCAPFHVDGVFDGIDDSYWYYHGGGPYRSLWQCHAFYG